MNKFASDESSTVSLHKTFWRWFSFSVLALVVAAALPAMSADVFIDEGDGDFAATPVSSPASAPHAHGGKAPASEDVPPANPGMDLDAVGSSDPIGNPPPPPAGVDLGQPADTSMGEPMGTPVAEPKPAKKTVKASKKKETKKVSKKSSKKKDTKKASKKSKKPGKKADKKTAKKSSKKKPVAATGKKSKRDVASFAGGKYATTSKSCAMESAPGAGDTVGTTMGGRKLWVEDAGNTSYWKVYGKSGNAAYVARDCF